MFEKVKQVVVQAGEESVLETHPHYRTAVGVLGVTLPPILVVYALLRSEGLQSSISAYYFTSGRDWFVGVIWVIGVFLFFYQFRPVDSDAKQSPEKIKSGKADAWLGKAAGLSAIAVALFPTNPPPASPAQPPTIGMIHGVAAAALFICLALFPLLLFSQSERWKRLYQAYGIAMLVLLLLIVAYAFLPNSVRIALAPLRPVFALETGMILLFGGSWFHKGLDLAQQKQAERQQQEAHRQAA